MSRTEKLAPIDTGSNAWQRFWNRGGWWRAVLMAVIYLALYNGMGLALAPVLSGLVNVENLFGDPLSAFLAIGLQPLLGSIVLVIIAMSIGWLPRPLFGRQPALPRRWWFWLGPILVLIPIVGRLFGIDYARYGAGVVLAVFAAGLFVGFSEDFLTRGMAVVMLRRHGYREWAVMALSSVIFASLHFSNFFTGQPVSTVLPTVIYAFAFGVCMYATLRVGGSLVWPILLHMFTDPTTILASGGIDDGTHATLNAGNGIAVAGTFAYLAWAVVLLIVTRGDAEGRADADEQPRRRVTHAEPTAS